MRYAIINNGLVENIAVSDDPAFAAQQGWVPATEEAEIGGTYEGGVFAPPAPYVPTPEERIAELKRLLAETDYVALSDYDKEKPEVFAQRQAWRDEIRVLEAE